MSDSPTPTRDWLAEAIRNAHNSSCGSCRSGARTCPDHAAEAVCEAVRRERLFIMPQVDADGLTALRRVTGVTAADEGVAR